ncbi:hypothetical protein GCM10010837_48020 [Aminobacter niigataensis]
MFLLMVGLAVVNRLYLLPRALAHRAVAGSPNQQLMALRRKMLMEQVLGLLALAAVSVFATLPPAIHGATHDHTIGTEIAESARQAGVCLTEGPVRSVPARGEQPAYFPQNQGRRD